MLKIRLRRMGAIRQPHYRIVVADARAPRDGAFLDILGHYNPRTEPATIEVDTGKYDEWKGKGAQPTEAVERLVRQYNKQARKAAAAAAAGAAAPAKGTRAASRKGVQAPAATEAPANEAPANEAAAEATRDGGAGSEALVGSPEQFPGEDNTDAPVLEAASQTPEGAAEGQTDTDTAS